MDLKEERRGRGKGEIAGPVTNPDISPRTAGTTRTKVECLRIKARRAKEVRYPKS